MHLDFPWIFGHESDTNHLQYQVAGTLVDICIKIFVECLTIKNSHFDKEGLHLFLLFYCRCTSPTSVLKT